MDTGFDGISFAGSDLRYSFRLTGSYPRLVLQKGVMGELHYGVRPTYIPNSPGWFRGVMNRRGGLVPVFDITLWLGLGRDPSADKRGILLLDSQPKTAGVWILGEPKLIELSPNDGHSRAEFPDALRPYLGQGFDSEEGKCFEFDHQSWFRLAGGRSML